MIEYLIYHVIFINIVSYLLMRKDKTASKKGDWRIPENNLFLLALAGGSVGIYSGMRFPPYHKTNKLLFKYGIPLLIGIQIFVVIYVINY